ncbi:uncharacterized protein LOC126671891 [Mercurialis annua]|uniref:uncharacterized protein LOC126671891 n=1 Tax=Mercurialis annua TaxID=3986 RepID=UPI00215F61FA|nr:uncharacterized protein LOC126671891 [Mercurialis annua]
MANLQSAEPSTPTTLQLSGSLHGDIIQVEGDTGSLQFSVKFNIHNKHNRNHNHGSDDHFSPLAANFFGNNRLFENLSPSSSYITPNNDRIVEAAAVESDIRKTVNIMTRLRSGAISPVKYYLPRVSAVSSESSKRKVKCRTGRKKDLLKTVLRRHSLPVRPCNSYAFFVMANWNSVNCSSFSEASKSLGQMWCQISHKEKKVFSDMALKDSARYKKQRLLLQG